MQAFFICGLSSAGLAVAVKLSRYLLGVAARPRRACKAKESFS